MLKYFESEMTRAAEDTRNANYEYSSKNRHKGILISIMSRNTDLEDDILSFFDDSTTSVEQFMTNPRRKQRMITELGGKDGYFEERVNDMIDLLLRLNIIEPLPVTRGEPVSFINNGLNIRISEEATSDQLETIEEDKLRAEVLNYIVNDTISNIEQSKVILSDPINYKTTKDHFRRNTGIVGPKKIAAVYNSVNKWIERHLTIMDANKKQVPYVLYDKFGFGKPIMKTAVFADLIVRSDEYNKYVEAIGAEQAVPYEEMEEADGQWYINIHEWRQFLFRTGDWSSDHVGSLEDLYQWETQKALGIEEPIDPVSKRIIDGTKLPVATPIKPQHMGPLAEEGFKMGMYKLSMMPLLPSVTKQFPELDKLRRNMERDQIGAAGFRTGIKAEALLTEPNGSIQNFYENDGTFDENRTLHTQDTYYKFWGIQQDMGFKSKNTVVTGSQMMKQITNGIFEGGKVAKGKKKLGENAKKYFALNKKRIELGMVNLIEGIGLEIVDENTYRVKDINILVDKFKREAQRRDDPDNVIDAIESLRDGSTIDTLINRERLENILLSIADAMTTGQKRSGSSKVQISNGVGKTKRKLLKEYSSDGQVWDSSDLRSYTTEKVGKTVTTRAEVYLPSYMNRFVKAGQSLHGIDSRLLRMVGFRIPTQGLNSIESLVVKGFLPESAGDAVMLPSEVVAKTGSDFDIDKLFMYFPNFYYGVGDEPIYIEHSNNLDEMHTMYDEYEAIQYKRAAIRVIGTTKAAGFIGKEISSYVREMGKTQTVTPTMLRNKLAEVRAKANETSRVEYDIAIGTLDAMIADDADTPLLMSFNEFHKQATENAISEVQSDIILDPQNFAQLINPISAKILSNEAAAIRKLRGYTEQMEDEREDVPMHRMVEREYLLVVGEQFVGATKNIGITAITSTFDIICKQHNITVPRLIVYENPDTPEVSTHINLPHNQDKKGNITLAMLRDKNDSHNIPEMLSQWINASVDAMTDAFMFDLNAGKRTLNTFLYLTMAGVPLNYISRFMNQPIVRDYLQNLDSWQSLMMQSNTDGEGGRKFKSKEEVRKLTTERYRAYLEVNKIPAERTPEEEMNIDDMESDIERGVKIERTGEMENAMYARRQLGVLEDFLRYMETADLIRQASSGLNYDTESGGANVSELLFRVDKTERLIFNEVLTNYGEIFEQGYIAPYYEAVNKFRHIFDPLFTYLNDDNVNAQFNKLFAIFNHEDNDVPELRAIKVVDRFKWELNAYILTTQNYRYNRQKVERTMTSQAKKLFYNGKKSISYRLERMQDKFEKRGESMQLLKALEPNHPDYAGDSSNVIMRVKRLDKIEANTLTAEWRELFDREPKFARDLAIATMLQYGIQPSPFSFSKFMPTEVYKEMMESAMDNINQLEPEQQRAMFEDYYLQFFKRNYENDDIVPLQYKRGKFSAKMLLYPYVKRWKKKTEYKETSASELSRQKGRRQRVVERVPILESTDPDSGKVKLGYTKKDFRGKKVITAYERTNATIAGKERTSEYDEPVEVNETEGNIRYEESKQKGYTSRTNANARAGVTVYLKATPESPGRGTTLKGVKTFWKKRWTTAFQDVYVPVSDNLPKNKKLDQKQVDRVVDALNRQNARTLNFAGNRLGIFLSKGHTQADVDTIARKFLKAVLTHPNLKNNNLTIWSGGQTGADEAGAKAGRDLGRKVRVLAPNGWQYETVEDGKKVTKYGKKGFKKRFDEDSYNQLSNDSNLANDEHIDTKMKSWLGSMGISFENVEEITDRQGNPIDAIAKADMLMKAVQVVEGKADITTLPEETAHFLVELLGDDNPLLKGMMNAVEGTDVHKDVISEYSDIYNGDETKLLKEAVGKMIAKTVVRKEQDVQAGAFKRMWQGAWKWLKRHLSKVSSRFIEEDLSAYIEAADILLGEKTDIPFVDIASEGIYYQVTAEEKELSKKVRADLRVNRAMRDVEVEGYKKVTGEKIMNRVTDYVKRFNAKKYRRSEGSDYQLPKLKGTLTHKYLELIGRRIFEGKTTNHSKIEKEVIDTLTDKRDIANAEFLEKKKSFFKLTPGHYKELENGIKAIKKQVLARQKEIDPKNPTDVEFFPELIIYSESGDLAGTIDLAVVYSNGKVGIYDYKGINNLKTYQDKVFYKEDEYQVQISQYKKILQSDYGVKEFAETRIVPIDMRINPKTEAFDRLAMGSTDINNVNRPYLQQVPVDDELTGDPELDKTLSKMLVLYDTLSKQLRAKRNDELFNRVMDLRRSIRKLQLDSDIRYVADQVNSLYKDFNKRLKLANTHGKSFALDLLTEYRHYVGIYEEFGIDAMDRARKLKDKKTMEKIEKVSHNMKYLKGMIYQKEVELETDINDGIDLTAAAPAEGMMGKLFKQAEKFNRGAIRKFGLMIRQISDATRKEVYEYVDDITIKHNALKDWAKNNGMSLQQAFDKLIGTTTDKDGKKVSTGNLIAKFTPEFHEQRKKANENQNFAWYTANTDIEKVGSKYYYTGKAKDQFEERQKGYIEHLKSRYPKHEKNKDEKERYNAALLSWNMRYNVTAHPNSAVFNMANPFIQYSEIEDNFSSEYKELFLPQNKALKDYYDMYVDYNYKFNKMVGMEIKGNFIANIHKSTIDKIGDSGLRGVLGIKDSVLRSMEIREFDPVKGSIDPTSGKPIPIIPLFYSDKLRGRLSDKEKRQIREEVKDETSFTEGTEAFEEEVGRRIASQEYQEGTKSKSRDLSRSLVMFAEAAVTHRSLTENESAALALRDILKSQLQETQITDGTNRKVMNKYTQKIATMLGVPLGEIDAMDQFINMYFYGQTTQSKDIGFGKDKKYSGTKAYQNIIKYTSAKALGLKPILAAGNLLGILSNYHMMGAEGKYFSKKDMIEGLKMMFNNRDEYKLALGFFEPFVRDMTFKKANDLSSKRIVKGFTMDNLFIMHRKGDELLDAQILMAMMNAYGIHNGKVVRLTKLARIEGADTRSLMERMSTTEDGKIAIEGMTDNKELGDAMYTDFRAKVQHMATAIKGNMPDEAKNLVNATLMGQALMHFRNWIPGLVETRFKGLTYDDVMDDHDVGRFRVMVGEFTGRTVVPKLKTFTTLLAEVSLGYIPGTNFFNEKTINMEATQRFYDRYMDENRQLSREDFTIDDFVELRLQKLRGMAAELRIYMSFLFLVFAGKAMIPEEEEEGEMSPMAEIARDLATNAFRVTQRGLLELSFFFNPESIVTILKSPAPSMRTFTDLYRFLENTIDETRDVIFGEDSIQDKSPRGYYFSKLVPVWTSWTDFWDIWDTYNKDRGW
jgi:hypothetical protein